MNEWRNQAWYIHTMEHCSVLKRKDILACYSMDESWVQYCKWNKTVTKNTNIVWLHLHEVSSIMKFIKAESRIEVARH